MLLLLPPPFALQVFLLLLGLSKPMGRVAFLKQKGRNEGQEKERVANVWVSLRRSLHCKPEPGEVLDPETKRPCRSGCSRSIANLKDVIHGSKRHLEMPPSCSPRSIGSSEFLNPLTHEVILSSSKCELRITGFHEGGSAFEGTLKPGTPGPGGLSPSIRGPIGVPSGSFGRLSVGSTSRASVEYASCHKCGEKGLKFESLEAHYLSKHAVSELAEGDSSRKIVEIICRTSLPKCEPNCGRIERILKVHNMQKTLGRFEEHREAVKSRASRHPKKHPRCLADGNELLRFHGTTIACGLGGSKSCSGLCASEKCGVCRIVRHGFPAMKEAKGIVGVFTASTSARALEAVQGLCENDGCGSSVKKALLVCRVIAGRVHRPLENFEEIDAQTGFDSLAGKLGLYSNIEELYLLNPRALLPCFIVIFRA